MKTMKRCCIPVVDLHVPIRASQNRVRPPRGISGQRNRTGE